MTDYPSFGPVTWSYCICCGGLLPSVVCRHPLQHVGHVEGWWSSKMVVGIEWQRGEDMTIQHQSHDLLRVGPNWLGKLLSFGTTITTISWLDHHHHHNLTTPQHVQCACMPQMSTTDNDEWGLRHRCLVLGTFFSLSIFIVVANDYYKCPPLLTTTYNDKWSNKLQQQRW